MKKVLGLLLTAMFVIVLAACGGNEANSNSSNQTSNDQVEQGNQQTNEQSSDHTSNGEKGTEDRDAADSLQTEYPLTVTDASGKEVVFEQAPQRIASIAPSMTEVLFALGLDDRIVGVGEYDNYPEAALEKPRVGNLQGNAEALLAVEPDLIVAGVSLNGATVENLRTLNLTVFATEPTTIDEVIDMILLMGVITDSQEQAEEVAAKMRADKQLVIDTVSGLTEADKKKVYIEYSPLWTAGKGSFMDELIVLSGGINIASELDQWAQISSEAVIEANPDVILYADTTDYETGKPLVESIISRPGWGQLSAMQSEAIVGINEDMLSRNGPRITDALLEVAKGIYPELYE